MNELLKIEGLTKRYSGNLFALNDLHLTLNGGEIVGLLGPNGSGKTTLIKLVNDCLYPTTGTILVNGNPLGPESKEDIAYLPDCTFLNESMRVNNLLNYYQDFYNNFDKDKAWNMLRDLGINQNARMKTLSKGTKEKVQLVLTMSRNAKLYILDEPIGGVDPAARDYILRTILSNYSEDATVLISTHLIADIENVLDRVLFLKQGQLVLNSTVDEIRSEKGKSVDALFREVFQC